MINNSKRIAIYTQAAGQTDTTAVGGELLSGLVLMDARIADDMQMMEHPVENGSKITDYEVRNPVEISIQASLSLSDQNAATNTYSELKQLYTDGVAVMVKCSLDVYRNMLLSGIPYDELPTNYDRLVFSLTFKEVILVEPVYAPLPPGRVRAPADASTIPTGQVQAEENKSFGAAIYDVTIGAVLSK